MWYWLPVVANIWVTTSHQPGCQLVYDLCKSFCAPGSLCYKYLQWYTLTLLISCGRCLQPICFLRLSRRQMLTFQSLTTQLWIDKRTILWMWVAVGTVFAPEPRYQPLWTDHGSVCYFCFVRQLFKLLSLLSYPKKLMLIFDWWPHYSSGVISSNRTLSAQNSEFISPDTQFTIN